MRDPAASGNEAQADHARTPADVAARMGADPTRGLTGDEAAGRLRRDGANQLDRDAQVPWGRLLARQLTSPMILLLIGAGALSAALGDLTEAQVILGVVALNAAIGFRQEARAGRAMASLAAMAAPTVSVIRDGRRRAVPAADLVAGDLVRLEAGSRVPADGRVLEAHALRVEESALTGESAGVDKQVAAVGRDAPLAERTSMAYAGTSVTAGRGTVLVTATGMRAELGRIAGLLQGASPGKTPLQLRLDALVRRLAVGVGGVVTVVLLLGLVRDEAWDTLLLTAVSLAVAAIPESLPVVVTITLALGAQRMLRRSALIRRLYAVETLGSVTTICSDKTGTLTQNRMTVTALEVAGRRVTAGPGDPVQPAGDHDGPLRLLLLGGALCNDTEVAQDGSLAGDPTETALVAVAARYGLDLRAMQAALPRCGELPFDSDRKRMTTMHAVPATPEAVPAGLRAAFAAGQLTGSAASRVCFTKGAFDGLLACCDHVLEDGRPVPLDEERRHGVRVAAQEMAAAGIRVLGVAMRRWPAQPEAPARQVESGLTLLGLQGMTDPVRPEASAAVRTCREAGIRAVMITGDHPLTAMAIARDLGLAQAGDRAVTGNEVGALTAPDLLATLRSTAVYARVSPADKMRLVRALQADGQVVAMTGDGVNDAPALKQADIGVAMGITGTDVTKDAADMVLQDDDFATIVRAVREGRVVFDNIRKFIRNILSGNLAEVSVMIVAPLLGMPIPLLPLQILWLNLATDGLPAIALAVEPAEQGVMLRPPTSRRESVFGPDRGRRILVRGSALTLLALLPAYLLWRAGDPAWQTVLFTSIAFAELAGGFAMRSEQLSLRRLGLLTNRALVAAVALTAALQVLLVTVPVAREVLGLAPMAARHWALAVGIALLYVVFIEAHKALRRPGGERHEPQPTLRGEVSADLA
ncbi:MAG: ATPase, P-type (transporting), superfamily, subfamily [Frankiales bacterium]|nr:ATPase, P-type (transporting), superfamily, subfamily [Frankiales bacterium]